MKPPVFFFEGVDPAPSDSQRSDKGALVIAGATPRLWDDKGNFKLSDNEADWFFDYIYARVLDHKTKASARQWSGIIHEHHQRFGLEKILMDAGAGGGGVLIQRELRSPKQLIQAIETEMKPIADQVEGPRLVAHADFILHMFKRGDPGVDSVWPSADGSKSLAGDELLKDGLYSKMKEALDTGMVAWPAPVSDWYDEKKAEAEKWPEERKWALINLESATIQLKQIMVATQEDGTHIFTKRGARQFNSIGHDDIALASMMCRGAFLIWLRGGSFAEDVDDKDAVGCCVW